MQELFGAYANRLELLRSAAGDMRFWGGSACSGTEAVCSCMYLEAKVYMGSWQLCNSFLLVFSHFFIFINSCSLLSRFLPTLPRQHRRSGRELAPSWTHKVTATI